MGEREREGRGERESERGVRGRERRGEERIEGRGDRE